jgi:hypothetical protein
VEHSRLRGTGFLLSKQGDEKVSNSFSPRLRHFYLETGHWLLGQTWTTFMVVLLPEDLDFAGAAEGIVFGRQPQLRFTSGPWQLSLENPETVVTPYEGGPGKVTESGRLPDLVARHNVKGDWGSLGIAIIGRQLHYKDVANAIDDQRSGYGITVGSEIKLGQRDDLLMRSASLPVSWPTATSGPRGYGLASMSRYSLETMTRPSLVASSIGMPRATRPICSTRPSGSSRSAWS